MRNRKIQISLIVFTLYISLSSSQTARDIVIKKMSLTFSGALTFATFQDGRNFDVSIVNMPLHFPFCFFFLIHFFFNLKIIFRNTYIFTKAFG